MSAASRSLSFGRSSPARARYGRSAPGLLLLLRVLGQQGGRPGIGASGAHQDPVDGCRPRIDPRQMRAHPTAACQDPRRPRAHGRWRDPAGASPSMDSVIESRARGKYTENIHSITRGPARRYERGSGDCDSQGCMIPLGSCGQLRSGREKRKYDRDQGSESRTPPMACLSVCHMFTVSRRAGMPMPTPAERNKQGWWH